MPQGGLFRILLFAEVSRMKRILACCAPAALPKLAAAAGEGYEFVLAEGELTPSGCERYDAVLLVLPAFSPAAAEKATRLAREAAVGIAALVREQDRAEADALLGEAGVPVAAGGGKQAAQLLAVAVRITQRLRLLGREAERLRGTIDDLKLIDRAKCALIQYLNMTESDAHRFIEKQSMNRHLPKREVALEILKTYES